MNLNNFTIKAAEAIQQAQQIAFNKQSANIETDHILAALLQQEDSPVAYLLKKNAVNVANVEALLEHRCRAAHYRIAKRALAEPHGYGSDHINLLVFVVHQRKHLGRRQTGQVEHRVEHMRAAVV